MSISAHRAVKRDVGWREIPPAHITGLCRLLNDSYADRLRSLGALFDFELNALVFLE